MILVIVLRKKLREKPSMTYLALLGAVYLLTVTLTIIDHFILHMNVVPNNAYCVVMAIMRPWPPRVSYVTLIALTADRLYMVKSPLEAQYKITHSKVFLIMLGYITLSFLPSIPRFWQFIYVNGTCNLLEDSLSTITTITGILDNVLFMIAPLVTLIVLNILIVHTLKEAEKTKRDMTGGKAQKEVSGQIMKVLIVTTVWFLLCTTLGIIIFILVQMYTSEPTLESLKSRWAHIQFTLAASFFIDVNHCINLFLYCMTGTLFRDEFKKVFICKKERHLMD